MDIVLEITDYYLFDRAYASLLPKGGAVHQYVEKAASLELVQKIPFLGQTIPSELSVNGTSSAVSTTFAYLSNAVSNFQNKEEVYGLPNFLPASEYIDASFLSRSNIFREVLSIFLVTAIFGWVLYFTVAYLSYLFVFDRKIFNHPRYLKNQVYLEIVQASTAIPVMVLLTAPFFIAELNGLSCLYMDINESTGGWKALLFQIPAFILFTDCGIYFIHRFLHWPSVYKRLHKPHHKWIVCTPFASHAFHPVDGWFQSIPYHIYPLLFPLHKVLYLLLFTFVNFWTVMIHDGNYMSNDPVVNGTACHTVHHLYFNYNYGQFTTLWDRIGNSYRRPDDSLFVKDTKKEEEAKLWKEQTVQMEAIRGKLEGADDDRVYIE
ncbi:uncharacterized protein CANTADRAFT_47515 [Suhomyces tanzawaensis NRRL Y-17324]|uniref:Fatty acid hydroxylase domain-containing protein n=1 Tax=Suhomyces tanzawaensis NRRL Y-17324 TaxID=984487 RepID=A0A1E4SN14_9ASCO|nr:uncharacterized protein CANTADRAFT_47515 [Suhomyces tanzawaensis NRRL Y-17324]ODV80911.1 hypothetical protein CANTADRAFT_47515 [Suhomyces tanzawaensis NRRL Y-17324]